MSWKADHSELTEQPLRVEHLIFQRNIKEFLYLFSDVHQVYAWHRTETLSSEVCPGTPIFAHSSDCHQYLRKNEIEVSYSNYDEK